MSKGPFSDVEDPHEQHLLDTLDTYLRAPISGEGQTASEFAVAIFSLIKTEGWTPGVLLHQKDVEIRDLKNEVKRLKKAHVEELKYRPGGPMPKPNPNGLKSIAGDWLESPTIRNTNPINTTVVKYPDFMITWAQALGQENMFRATNDF